MLGKPVIARQREVVAVGKERIEGAERAADRVAVARGDVELQSQARRPGDLLEGVAGDRAQVPGADVLAADGPELAHGLGIPVEAAERAGKMHIEDVAALVAACAEVARAVLGEARIVGGEADVLAQLPLDPQAAEGLLAGAVVVERIGTKGLDRLAVEADEAPWADFVVDPGGVEGLPHVRPVAHRDEALQVERHLLAAEAQLQRTRAQGLDQSDEALLEIEIIRVHRRQRRLPRREVALDLREELERAEPQVGVQLRATEEIVEIAAAADAEVRRVVGLEPLADVQPERQVCLGITRRERNVFQRVQRLARHAPDRPAPTNPPASG